MIAIERGVLTLETPHALRTDRAPARPGYGLQPTVTIESSPSAGVPSLVEPVS
jgi:hypothetical protein